MIDKTIIPDTGTECIPEMRVYFATPERSNTTTREHLLAASHLGYPGKCWREGGREQGRSQDDNFCLIASQKLMAIKQLSILTVQDVPV